MTEDENLVEYTPFVVWVLFFSYIFFPNRDVFNPKGRRYFYDLLKKIVQSPFTKITFLITWASDQAVSFVIPFKDFSYTICFYTSDINLQSVKKCLNASHIQGVLVTYVVAILPLILRMIQCYRLAMQQNGQFKGHIQYYNFFKYCSSVLTATLSYLSTIQSKFFILFVISSIFSTCFSYYWDLKHDWGFFEKNSKHKFLRNHLSYKSPIFYYVAIAVNFIFRCAWTLTISPSVVEYFHKSTFLPFLTGSLEICRRCMWNFIRVQKEHLVNCQDYVIMKPDVEKLIQKFKGKDRPSKIQAFESNQQAYLGYNQKLKQSFVDQIKRDLNLAYYFGQQQYQRQWAEINPAKVSLRKTQYLNLRQKQKNLFYQTKDTIKYDEDLLQSIY